MKQQQERMVELVFNRNDIYFFELHHQRMASANNFKHSLAATPPPPPHPKGGGGGINNINGKHFLWRSSTVNESTQR